MPAGSIRATGVTRDVWISPLWTSRRALCHDHERWHRYVQLLAGKARQDTNYLSDTGFGRYFPEYVAEAVERGLITGERLDLSAYRVMLEKFRVGIFDNPYRDWETALNLIGSTEYIAEQYEIKDIYDIKRARRDVVNALEECMMTASTILLKNDNNLLPLSQGTKVYYESNNSTMQELTIPFLGQFAEVVDDMGEADVIVIRSLAWTALSGYPDEALRPASRWFSFRRSPATPLAGIAEVRFFGRSSQPPTVRARTMGVIASIPTSIPKCWSIYCLGAVSPAAALCSRSAVPPTITSCPSVTSVLILVWTTSPGCTWRPL